MERVIVIWRIPAMIPYENISLANTLPIEMRRVLQRAFIDLMLTPEGKAAIDAQVVGKLSQVTKLDVVLVTGHTDRLGTDAYNQKLSERRADAVRDYLVSKGVDKAKIETIGMGEKQPVVQCDQKAMKALIECLQPNRRVDVEVKGETKK